MRVPVPSLLRAVRRRLRSLGRVPVRVRVAAVRFPFSPVRRRLGGLGRVRVVTLVTFVVGAGILDVGARTLGPGAPESQAVRADAINLLADGPPPLVWRGTAANASLRRSQRRRPRREAAAYYRRTVSEHVPTTVRAGFLPLYREAGRAFGVDWRLVASIHRQETAFSTEPSTYHGLNRFGCCGGPMQFNVTNGPVSTWDLYRQAFRAGQRPRRYPHRTRSHPSLYDDFDAIMAAASLLADGGAGPSLDGGSWAAAYAYYGHDLFGVTYANQVLARAQVWQRDGFCLNCALDEGVVAQLDDAYGVAARQQLDDADARKRAAKKAKAARKRARARRRRARRRRLVREQAARERRPSAGSLKTSSPPSGGSGAGAASPSGQRKPPKPTITTPTTPTPAVPPVPTTSTDAPAPAPSCPGLQHLLGRC